VKEKVFCIPNNYLNFAKDLMEITNTESGEPLISEFIRTDSVYSGPKRDALPDVLLEWNKSAPIREIHSPILGKIKLPYRKRTGDHTFKSGALYSSCPNELDEGNFSEEIHVKEIENWLLKSMNT